MRKVTLLIIVILLYTGSVSAALGDQIMSSTQLQWKWGLEGEPNLEWGSFISLDQKFFQLYIGKTKVDWGVGETGSLGLSTNSPAIWQLGYWLQIPEGSKLGNLLLPKVNYSHFMSILDQKSNKWIFGQRIQTDLYDKIQISAWELMVTSDKVFPAYYIPVPLFPLYAKQHIGYKLGKKIYDFNSNALIGGDFIYEWGKNKAVYGELLVDDFPQSSQDINPKKIAGLIGLKWKDAEENWHVWSEYVRVNNFVYTHRNADNAFVYQGQILGHWIGMDSDLLAIGTRYNLTDTDQIIVEGHLIRKGSGSYVDNWEVNLGSDYEFLTGTVEHKQELKIQYQKELFNELYLHTSTLMGRSFNANHIVGLDQNYFTAHIGISYSFYLNLWKK